MDKVDRLRNKVLPLFWALGNVLSTTVLTNTSKPTRWPGITPPPYR